MFQIMTPCWLVSEVTFVVYYYPFLSISYRSYVSIRIKSPADAAVVAVTPSPCNGQTLPFALYCPTLRLTAEEPSTNASTRPAVVAERMTSLFGGIVFPAFT